MILRMLGERLAFLSQNSDSSRIKYLKVGNKLMYKVLIVVNRGARI